MVESNRESAADMKRGVSGYSSHKIRQADKKYLRSCGSRAFVFFGFLGVRGDSWVCRTWLTIHISKKLETTYYFP